VGDEEKPPLMEVLLYHFTIILLRASPLSKAGGTGEFFKFFDWKSGIRCYHLINKKLGKICYDKC